MMATRSLFLVVMALWLSPAHAVVLCARPKADSTYSTSIKLRETCRATETQLGEAADGTHGGSSER